MRVVALVQARMGSTRLPGKVLMDLAGEPMLMRVVNRVRGAKNIDQVVVATTENQVDDPIEKLCREHNWSTYRGSENDVLDRFYKAAKLYQADTIVRITSDCPLIAPKVIDQVVEVFKNRQPRIDYASNIIGKRTFPRGLDTEVISFRALERAWTEDKNPDWREHVTPYIRRHPEKFSRKGVFHKEDLAAMRWTVDTRDDLSFVRKIFEEFDHDQFSWQEVMTLLENHPEWLDINRDIQQKIVK